MQGMWDYKNYKNFLEKYGLKGKQEGTKDV